MVAVAGVATTELFDADLRQLLWVELVTSRPEQVRVTVTGRGVHADPVEVVVDGAARVEVAVALPGPVGTRVPVRVTAGTAVHRADVVVAEPGWTVHLVPHFHVDAVWWNTQAATISEWEHRQWSASPALPFQRSAFAVLDAHLDRADLDGDYRFVLDGVDVLKPYRDRFPWRRALITRLLGEGRLEIVGGCWNQPASTLVATETVRRAVEQGLAYQRGVLGADVRTAWALDVFGHAPQYPAVLAEAGLSATVFARGPFHQWGPLLGSPFDRPAERGVASAIEFPDRFTWAAPSGAGVTAQYLSAHYTAGHRLDAAETLDEAVAVVHELLGLLRPRAAGRSVVVPVGTDLARPDRWVTEVVRRWPYRWPQVRCSTALDALADRPVLRTQTREMGPVYPGQDVTHVAVKQAHAACEALLADAEAFAALTGAPPSAELERAGALLVYGAHHDAVTGTCSDQVYLDLVAGWREAYDLARSVLHTALAPLGETGSVVVANPLPGSRTDAVTVVVDAPPACRGLRLLDEAGAEVACVVEGAEHGPDGLRSVALTVLARDVPGIGYRTLRVEPAADLPSWTEAPGTRIANAAFAVEVDPERGGCVTAWTDLRDGAALLAPGALGGELLACEEYPTHPEFGEGPWHLAPTGRVRGSSVAPAVVRRFVSPVGERIEVDHPTAGHRTRYTCWYDVPRVDVAVTVADGAVADTVLRVRWPTAVRGGLPLADAGECVVGRTAAAPDVDVARRPWTLDGSSRTWFGVGATVVARFADDTAGPIGVAEIVLGPAVTADETVTLTSALAAAGVTATVTAHTDVRYGDLRRDSNLPDLRIVVERGSSALRWRPAGVQRSEAGDDRTAAEALPCLLIDEPDAAALARRLGDLAHTVRTSREIRVGWTCAPDPPWDGRTIAIAHRGTPGGCVDPDGALHLSLLRGCRAWPAGGWVDPPRRVDPAGAPFAAQRFTHVITYALLAGRGDWHAAGTAEAAQAYARPLRAVPGQGGGAPARVMLLAVTPPAVRVSAVRARDGATAVRLHSLAPVPVAASVHPAGGQPAATTVPAAGSVVVSVPGPRRVSRAGHGAPAAFSRWWTRSTGPPPLGGLPVAVHLHPPPPAGGRFLVTVASDLGVAVRLRLAVTGPARLVGPVEVDLEPGGWAQRDLEVTGTAGAVVAVRAEIDGEPSAWDAFVVGARPGDGPLEIVQQPVPHPDRRGGLTAVLRTRTVDPVDARVEAVLPFGSWHLVPDPVTEVSVRPGHDQAVTVRLHVPPAAQPGRWWGLLVVRCLDQVLYTAATRVAVE